MNSEKNIAMATKNEVVLDTIGRLLDEVIVHNEDPRHVTNRQFIRFVRKLTVKLRQKGQRYEKFSGGTGDYEKW